jgi:hypothetical protein
MHVKDMQGHAETVQTLEMISKILLSKQYDSWDTLLALAVTRGYLFLLVSLVFVVESYGTPVETVSAPF